MAYEKQTPINELRVGNKIYGADPITVLTVSVDTLRSLERTPGLGMPIPLTHEVLEACGFKRSHDEYGGWLSSKSVRYQNYTEYQIRIREDSFGFFYQHTMITRITSLHQLQNLYYSLIQIELEYNP